MTDVSVFHSVLRKGKVTKTASINHNFRRQRRARAESIQPNALPLGQTCSHSFTWLEYSAFKAVGCMCTIRALELCESRGGRPGLPSLIILRFLWTLSNTQPTRTGQNSRAVWKSRWISSAPVPNKPTISVDVKQHFNCARSLSNW